MEYISAGDIEKYSYCPLSWWLSRQERDKRSRGVEEHKKIGKKAMEYERRYKKSKEFEKIVMYYSIAATMISIVGISLIYSSFIFSRVFHILSIFWLLVSLYLLWKSDKYTLVWKKKNFETVMVIAASSSTLFSVLAVSFFLPPNYIFGYLFEIVSLIWLFFASFFLYLSLRNEIKYSEIKKELKLPDGEIIYVDDMKKSPILKSEKFGIWGRPDLLMKIGKDYIPIEIKTGRVPRGPLFSHIMQLTAYMLLVEENYSAPSYGILKYGPIIFRIDYEEELKKILLQKVEEMRKAIKTGEVHRNHHRVNKCLHCSRRDICPEKLI